MLMGRTLWVGFSGMTIRVLCRKSRGRGRVFFVVCMIVAMVASEGEGEVGRVAGRGCSVESAVGIGNGDENGGLRGLGDRTS